MDGDEVVYHPITLECAELRKVGGWTLEGEDPSLYTQDRLWKGGRREWPAVPLPGYTDPAAKPGTSTGTGEEEEEVTPVFRGSHHPDMDQIKELLEIHHSITNVLKSMGNDACKAYQDSRLELVLDQIKSTDLDCKICGKHYKRASRMKNHFRKRHLGKTKHQCPTCHKYYTDGSALRNHMNTHDKKQFPFQCDKCSKSYKTKSKLAQHSPVHEKAQFACQFTHLGCDKEYKWKKGKKEHEPKCPYNPDLPEDAPFPCEKEYCNKGYWDKRSLLRHYRDHPLHKPS